MSNNNLPAWRLIIDAEPRDGYTNMAIDEALLQRQIENSSPPTIRFYSWRPPAISLGYAQSIETIDTESCRASGIDVVRRITGGGAILHLDDFTYSITAREDNPVVQGTLMDTYRKISQALLSGLQQLGIRAAFAPGKKNPEDGPVLGSAACFAASARYELIVGGRKIIGSAQRRKQGAILQHGSMPLRDVNRKLFDLLMFDDSQQRILALKRYRERATSLSEVLGRQITFAEAATAFLEGMKNILQIEIEPGCLQPCEMAQAKKLRNSKYASTPRNLSATDDDLKEEMARPLKSGLLTF